MITNSVSYEENLCEEDYNIDYSKPIVGYVPEYPVEAEA